MLRWWGSYLEEARPNSTTNGFRPVELPDLKVWKLKEFGPSLSKKRAKVVCWCHLFDMFSFWLFCVAHKSYNNVWKLTYLQRRCKYSSIFFWCFHTPYLFWVISRYVFRLKCNRLQDCFLQLLWLHIQKKVQESHAKCQTQGLFSKSTTTDFMAPLCVHLWNSVSSLGYWCIMWLEVTEVKDETVKSGSEISII